MKMMNVIKMKKKGVLSNIAIMILWIVFLVVGIAIIAFIVNYLLG